MKSGQFRMWALMALCLIAAIAVSLFAPITWRDYFISLTTQFGWPLVAAILTSAVIIVIALYAAKRRRASGIVALSLFISMVLHMVAASFFGFMVITTTSDEFTREEKKQELSTGLPSLAESILSQEVRAKFTESVLPDARKLDTEKKYSTEQADKKNVPAPKPELKQPDMREPEPEKVKAELASKPKAKVEEILAKVSEKIPDVSQAKVTAIKQVKTEKEVQNIVKTTPKELKIEPARKTLPDRPDTAEKISMEARLKDAQREQMREKMKVAAVQPAGQKKIEETLQKASLTEKANNLKLPPGTMTATAKTAEKEAKAQLAAKGSFDVSHKLASTPDAPSAKMLSRELSAAPVTIKSASLADAELARAEKMPAIKDSVKLDVSKGRLSLSEPVRISDTIAAAAGTGSGDSAPGRVISARPDLGTARSGLALSAGDSTVRPKASVKLEGGSGTAKTFISGKGGDKGPAPSGRSRVQEGLLASSGGGAASHQLVDVSGNAEALNAVSANTTEQGSGTGGNFPAALALVKADTGVDAGVAGPAPRRPGTRNGLPAGSSSSGRGTGLGGGDLAVPAALPRGGSGITGENLSGNSTNTSILASLIDVGGEAVAVTASSGGNMTGIIEASGGGPREGRQDLSAGRIQGGSPAGTEEGSALREILAQEGSISGTGTEASHKSYMRGAAVATSGTGPRTSKAVVESTQAGNGSGTGGAATLNAKIIPGIVEAFQGGGSAAESGSGGNAAQELARVEMRIGKSEAGIPQSGGEGKIARATLRTTSGTVTGHASSLVDSDVSSVNPSTGTKSSGLDKDFVLAKATGPAAAGGGTFSLGISAREVAGETGSASYGGTGSSSGPSSKSDVRVAKAGGQLVTDSVPGGGGGTGFDSSSMSSSASRPPARMEMSLAGTGSAMAGRSASIPAGNTLNEMPRTVISSELSDVPKSVPEKAIYKLRTPERRKEIAKEMGGSDKTEQAVERGLSWLAKAQSDDGRWDVDGFKTLAKNGGAGDRSEDDVALTGLCLLSYLGAGYTHVKGDYKETVRKAVNWLIVGQKEDGDLQRDGQMYGQAMATAAICECYSLTGDKRLLEPAEKAIGFILRAQNPEAGWRYQPRKDNDTSVTGWQVLAIKSAMIAGIKIPPQHFDWVGMWLDKVRLGKEGGLYSYMSGHGSTPTMTAEGWFCQLMMGEQTKTRGQTETIPYLMANQPVWSPRDHSINLYYWYYATLALHMSGAPEFDKWNQSLTKALLTGQVKNGAAAGSWDPVCILGERGGRVYTTATAALCLEVYYRYLPFYKQK